ncbi:MAG: cbb3-type cytochrome oxidase assembly protein CcoS [Granulosicoccus sp.]
MESLFILIPLSLIAVLVAVLIFFRMNETGQFDDDQGPAMSILLDDDSVPENDQKTPGKTD